MRRQARLPERPSKKAGRFIKDATKIVTAAAEQRRTVYIAQSFAGNGSTSATIVCFVTCPNDVVLEMQYAIDQAVGDLLAEHSQVKVDPKYDAQLLALAAKAKKVDGYVIEVKGYASTSGGASLNQQLSEDRASNVTNILLQKGHTPLTRMLAPGAMGEAHQVSDDKSAEGQAKNRRVVVRVLQNKAIAGV